MRCQRGGSAEEGTPMMVVAVLIVVLPLVFPGFPSAAVASRLGDTPHVAVGCERLIDGQTPPPSGSDFQSGLPDGTEFHLLAEHFWTVDRDDDLLLAMDEIVLDPEARSGPRAATGPQVFVVLVGEVEIDGEALSPGDAIAVDQGTRYQIINGDEATNAVVLRVAVAPTEEESEVGFGDTAKVPPFDPSEGFMTETLLIDTVGVEEGPVRLVLGCMSWSDPDVSLDDLSSTGPLGVYVAAGEVKTGEDGAGELEAGQSFVYDTGDTPHFASGSDDPLPSLLIAAFLPPDAPLWIPG